jgi:flagellar hook-basal body complex protein FliE
MIDAASSITSVVSGLGSIAGSTSSTATTTAPSASQATATTDFGQALAAAAGDAVNTLRKAESISMAGITGKASVQQVVESVMAAQETLQTALAIRDKAVSAYQEVSRMSI